MLRKLPVFCIAVALLAVGAASATDVGLTSVLYTAGKNVDVPISGTQRAPATFAAAQSEVKSLSSNNEKLSGQQKTLDQTLTGALGQMATGSKTDRGYVVSLSGVAFQSGQSQLSTEAKYVLAKLSKARAEAVVTFISEMGVPKSSMTAAGFGPDNPVAPNDTEGGRAKNRRVDIVMAEK